MPAGIAPVARKMRCECSTLTCLESDGGGASVFAKGGPGAADGFRRSRLAVCVRGGAVAKLAQNLPDHFGRKAAAGKKPGLARFVGK